MNSIIGSVLVVAPLLLAGSGCGSAPADAPPKLRLGDSACSECGMIVSDERYATATIVMGERGPEPRLFDDFNCQVNYETHGPALNVIARWVHDHDSRAWLPANSAHYVHSSNLQTPMASGIAAFASEEAAKRFAEELQGEVIPRPSPGSE